MMTRWQMLVPLMLLAGLPACVFGEESEPPVLSVDLYWDYDERTTHDSTCDTVPVAETEIHLRDSEGKELDLDEGGDRGCENTVNFYDLDLGSYELQVIGYNDAGDKAWEGTCEIWLDRFDRLFQCDVPQIDP